MFGEPPDNDDECNARLFIGDNYGDGTATMRCQLAPAHEGLHKEEFMRAGGAVTITWVADERRRCDHGCGQWDHAHGSVYDENPDTCPKNADDHEFSDCAWCNPDKTGETCEYCKKIYYYKEGHLRECPQKPFTCTVCGESGVGNHDWPNGCPKQHEAFQSQLLSLDLTQNPLHSMTSPASCSCGEGFIFGYALVKHVKQFILCPHCGSDPAPDQGGTYRWICGHRIDENAVTLGHDNTEKT